MYSDNLVQPNSVNASNVVIETNQVACFDKNMMQAFANKPTVFITLTFSTSIILVSFFIKAKPKTDIKMVDNRVIIITAVISFFICCLFTN